MNGHILVPLDGSALAECVLPHVQAVASAFDGRITLVHVLEGSQAEGGEDAIDSVDWHLQRCKAQVYLRETAARLQAINLDVNHVILEGPPAECIVDFANNTDVDLIAFSSHGRSGLSGWNVSSVAQKILGRSYKSTFLVRAYKSCGREPVDFRYERLFVGMDCSPQAEYILPAAITLAQFYKAHLILGTVIRKPQILHRFPLSKDDLELTERIVARSYCAASHYLEQLQSTLSLQGIELRTRLVVGDNVMASLHDMVEQENADLVMLAEHGYSGDNFWPYGSIATSFITYGTTSLMILQGLTRNQIEKPQAETVAANQEHVGSPQS
jgi:nucleotide-binding universal stress UspA family protein